VRVLLVQRSLGPPGGGNGVAAWMVHTLAAAHEVTTLTASAWSAAEVNAYYGTDIPEGRVRAVVAHRPWSWLARLPEHRFERLRMSSVLGAARPLAAGYDLLVTADNYGPFAEPGLQYLHFPLPLRPPAARLGPLVEVYFRFCDRVAGEPWERARENTTLANSRWTADRLSRLHGLNTAHVLYPPVVDPGGGLPWDARSNTFLCVGRFHGSKRVEVAMSILRRVRAAAIPGARLLIVGSAVDPEYTRRLHRWAARDRDWIDFREDVTRDELNALMGRCRYSIQAMVDEHFGMATAEMARAGCIVFGHRSGGTREVLDDDERVLWRTEDDAVARVGAIARDAGTRDAVRWRLARHARSFGTDRFAECFRTIVMDAAAALRQHRREGR
jgi:glycosyltransferase involved in cell wall biosynthesis